MKSKSLKSYHLPAVREVLQSFEAKPYLYLTLLAIASLLAVVEGTYFLPGLIILFTCIFAIVILPNRLLIEFSEDYMVVYHRVNKDDCMMVYYEDVLAYFIEKNRRYDLVYFVLTDGSEIHVPIFNRRGSEKILDMFLHGKKQKYKNILK